MLQHILLALKTDTATWILWGAFAVMSYVMMVQAHSVEGVSDATFAAFGASFVGSFASSRWASASVKKEEIRATNTTSDPV